MASKTGIATLIGATLLSLPIAAEPGVEAEEIAVNGGALHEQPSDTATSIETCWETFLNKEGLREGKNERGNYFLIVASSKVLVPEPAGAKNWLAGRNAAVSQAELTARKSLSDTIKATIRSDRATAIKMFGGDDSPPSLRSTVEQLSLAYKSRVLASSVLDAEIKKYDPEWKGGDKPKQEQEITRIQNRIEQNISSSTALYASGAFTAAQCEGPSSQDDGRYSVLVGLIWSPRLQKVAETIWNPRAPVDGAQPVAPIKEQFEQLSHDNPDWLAVTTGVRVFTDEKGQRVVVGFGAAPKTSLAAADEERAKLMALAAIQRFVGEKLEANSELRERYESREASSGALSSFDESKFEIQVAAKAKDMTLTGAAPVLKWRGEHPWSKAGMQVVAVAWNRSWALDSDRIGNVLNQAEKQMQKQGAVPHSPKESSTERTKESIGGVATPARGGAAPSTRDF